MIGDISAHAKERSTVRVEVREPYCARYLFGRQLESSTPLPLLMMIGGPQRQLKIFLGRESKDLWP
jgi:hypothetical protein